MKKLFAYVILSMLVNGLVPEGKTKEAAGMIMGLILLTSVMRSILYVFNLI